MTNEQITEARAIGCQIADRFGADGRATACFARLRDDVDGALELFEIPLRLLVPDDRALRLRLATVAFGALHDRLAELALAEAGATLN